MTFFAAFLISIQPTDAIWEWPFQNARIFCVSIQTFDWLKILHCLMSQNHGPLHAYINATQSLQYLPQNIHNVR